MGTYAQFAWIWLRAKAEQVRREEVGGGEIIATIVVLAVVIVLGVAFQEQIVGLFDQLWGQATGDSNNLGSGGKKPTTTTGG